MDLGSSHATDAGNENGSSEAASPMAVAVIGLALRFPGAPDARRFWRNLATGVESLTILDAAQRAKAGMPSDDGWVAAGGVMDGAESFDAGFFGYSPGEAESMDPQHRHFLECAWSALESAGHAPRGRPMRAGVYAGAGFTTYGGRGLSQGGGLSGGLGLAGDFLATRVAYALDLTGPGLTVQTACSTSLVAVHLACQALLAGECDLALAGGVSIRPPQLAAQRYQEGGIVSPDGHCRPFDVKAAGTVGGNGVGVVVLKRLADALADRDPIRAVILGTAINNDGRAKTGFSAPSVSGQAAVIEDALSMAGLRPGDISYVEAHGTATPLGDPIEVAALRQVFRGVAPGTCGLGAVKSNLGHLDAAAGVAGLIKTVLALEHRLLPPTLHFTSPNPRLELEGSPFHVVSSPRPWEGPAPRRAGVSAFGIGGTNAHAVLEEAPDVPADAPRREEEVLLLSARTEAALERMTAELGEHLREARPLLADVAHTLQVGRARFAWRRAVACGAGEDAVALLGSERARTVHDEGEGRGVAFLFPGGGAQRVNMGAALRKEPAWREAIDQCAELLKPLLGGDLRDVMFAGPDRFDAAIRELDRPLWSQPALFACDWALARLWQSWGVEPEAMLGHSLGEYVAACVAGVFSLEDALAVVVARGRLMERMPPGAMVSVLAPVEQVQPLLGPSLSVAAINGPGTCVISGTLEGIDALEQALASRGLEFKRVRYARGAHSSMMDPFLDEFAREVARVTLRPPERRVVSSVTGRWLEAHEATDPAYWVRHLRQTVRFSDGLACLLGEGERVLIEVGPGTTLTALARQHPACAAHPTVATLPMKSERPEPALTVLGEAWLAGVDIDWERFRAGERRRRVALPTYSFDHQRYAMDALVPGPRAPILEAGASPASTAPRTSRGKGAPVPPRNETERALVACFREVFRVEDVGIHDDFFSLGGDSLLALRLTARIADRLGRRLPLREVLEAPTVARLAQRLGDAGTDWRAPAERTRGLVRIQEGTRGTPLFFVHAVGGQVLFYRDLARAIDAERPAYGFESVGLEEGVTPHVTVEEMVNHYLEVLRTVQPSGPYLLVGSSLGGVLVYEMARRLSAEGQAVPLCALLDAPAPGSGLQVPRDDAETVSLMVERRVQVPPDRLRGLSLEAQLRLVVDEARRAGNALSDDPEEGVRQLRVWHANAVALERHALPRWDGGSFQFFRAAELLPRMPAHLELPWLGQGAVVRMEVVPGDHFTLLMPPHVQALGARLASLVPPER